MDAAARRRLHEDLVRLRDGDRAAARPVWEALWPPALALARGLVVDEADAQDAAQTALMKLFADAAAFDPSRSALGWAFALVGFECRTLRKKRARRKEERVPFSEQGVAAPERTGEQALINAEEVARVVDAFARLDERDRQTLQALLDGVAAGDPAQRKRRQRALDRLRALLLPKTGDEHV